MSQRAALYRDLPLHQLRTAMTTVIQPTSASNAWVIDSSQSQTGKPILANDPHLNFQSPIIWYFAGIDTPTLKIFGATVPGVPLHMLGHNHKVGWGITTPESDTSDLFIEQVTSGGKSYETPDGPKPFVTRTEVIQVRFNDPVAITVRETRHGPVVSDILASDDVLPDLLAGGKVLALSAALFQPGDRSADGVYRMNRATDVAEFIDAIKLFHAPQQNMMFADIMHLAACQFGNPATAACPYQAGVVSTTGQGGFPSPIYRRSLHRSAASSSTPTIK
jgi:penicillin G amidase